MDEKKCGVNDLNLQTEVGPRDLTDSPMLLANDVKQEVLQDPARYLSYIRPEDIRWIVESGGDITGSGISISRRSIIHEAASLGLTEIIAQFGGTVKLFDDSRFLIDRKKNSKGYFRVEHFMPILQAACERELPNLEMLETLLILGVDVNSKAIDSPQSSDLLTGPTALHRLAEATNWWQIDAIKLLVEKGANVNSTNHLGQAPLHIASMGASLTNMGEILGYWKHYCVEVLLDLGADPTILDNEGRSCLDKASDAPEIMRILLKRGGELKTSALFSAIQNLNHKAVQVLLDEGISVNALDTTKSCQVHYEVKDQAKYALFCAAFPYPFNRDIVDSVQLVKLLIERGADIYAPLNNRETLIHYVFEHSEYAIVCAFLDCAERINFDAVDQAGRTVFLAACNFTNVLPGFRHQHWVERETGPALKLLNHKTDFLAIDDDGRNALHHLFDNPDAEGEQILVFLKHPVSQKLFKQKDKKGFTPLHCALRLFRPAVCEALMEMGADLLEPDPNGSTALHHIASQSLQYHAPHRRSRVLEQHKPEFYEGCEQLWKKFLDLGGDINARDNEGSPPLFSFLASPTKNDYRNQNPDHCCHSENFDKYFADADLVALNADGETALHIIARREKTSNVNHERKLFEFMVGKGLDPLIEDRKGRSSLDIAAAYDHKEILDLFQYRS